MIQLFNKLNRPLVLDGAIGSLLQQQNVEIHKTLWSSYANISAPQQVENLHKAYINAGADIITTNTFRTNPITYDMASLKISNYDFVKASVKLAKVAVGENKKIFIAGSNPPAEDSYQKRRKVLKSEIEKNHKDHIDMLWDCGVDFILNETQSHFDEIRIICEYCRNKQIPFIVSLFVTAEGKIMSGELLSDVLKFVSNFNPVAIGLNCITPKVFNKIFCNIDRIVRWGFYLNCGSGNFSDKEIFEGVTPSNYIDIVKQKFNKKPVFIGSCCGSSPAHTTAIKEFVIENY